MRLLVTLSKYFLWRGFNIYLIYPKATCFWFPIHRIDDKLCLRSVTCKTGLQFWSVTKWFLPAGKINDKSWEKRLSCRSVIIYWQSWHLQVFLLPSAFYNVTLEYLWWCKLNKFFQNQHVVKKELRRMIYWIRMIVIKVLTWWCTQLVAQLNCFTFGYLFALLNKSAIKHGCTPLLWPSP